MPLISVMPYVAPRLSQNAIANNDNLVYSVGAHLSVQPLKFFLPTYSRIGKTLSVKDGRVAQPITIFSRAVSKSRVKIEYSIDVSGLGSWARAKQKLRFSASIVPKVSNPTPVTNFGFSSTLQMKFTNSHTIGLGGVLLVASDLRSTKNFGHVLPVQQVFPASFNVSDASVLSPIVSSKTATV